MKIFCASSLLVCIFYFGESPAQNTNCGLAVNQLQSYAARVNQIYQYEYWTGIPNFRCPACCDGWGRNFHPAQVGQCRQTMLVYLNNWYAQQSNYVNQTYYTIVNYCTTSPSKNYPDIVAPRVETGSGENTKIETERIADLRVGIDEDETAPIKIPNNPVGFKGN